MKAAVWVEPGKLVIEQREKPKAREDEVLIQVAYCGICGADVHIINGGVFPRERFSPPRILGHEFSGTVVEKGPNAVGISEGDRVAVHPWGACGKCYFCRNGQENFCKFPFFIMGAFAEYALVKDRQVYQLPKSMSMKVGAMVEPYSIGIHTMRRANIIPGSSVLIIGAGMIGFVCLELAQCCGASLTIMSDPIEEKRTLARSFNADLVVDPLKDSLDRIVLDATNGLGVDTVIDAVGIPLAIEQGLYLLKNGGTIVLTGTTPYSRQTPLNHFMVTAKEVTIAGINWSPYSFNQTLQMMMKLKPESLSTQEFSLDEIEKAIHVQMSGTVVKTLLRFQQVDAPTRTS